MSLISPFRAEKLLSPSAWACCQDGAKVVSLDGRLVVYRVGLTLYGIRPNTGAKP